jgi:hypothetical protein
MFLCPQSLSSTEASWMERPRQMDSQHTKSLHEVRPQGKREQNHLTEASRRPVITTVPPRHLPIMQPSILLRERGRALMLRLSVMRTKPGCRSTNDCTMGNRTRLWHISHNNQCRIIASCNQTSWQSTRRSQLLRPGSCNSFFRSCSE